MQESTIAVTILWSFLFIYSMLGSLDFGAGFWGMIYGKNAKTTAARLANRFLSPTWEVTNVFLVLMVVSLYSFFPFAASLLATLLLVPVGLGVILLTIRTTFMVFAEKVNRFQRTFTVISGLTGVLIPALLISILPITLGGFIDDSGDFPQLMFGKLFTSTTVYMHILFGLSTEFFLSALFLSDYAIEANDKKAHNTYRKLSIWLGPLTLILAVLTTITMNEEASWIVENIQENMYGFLMSFIFFLIGYTLLFVKRPNGERGYTRLAMISIILQYAFAIYAYGAAHMPYLVYPYLTIEDGFTNPATFYQIMIAFSIGMAILIPGFILFWRLFLKDKRYLEQE
ncbi:membrane protein [Pontibacillus halophilus JSM 076056 = DSM 19796]|uniref:Membrane protein n=1 Tax=Pontibacillus halophilus JSM 076056 = DSM 19796 TaxID=1385510 RepID=A0A0A5GKJ3_9BACI|nr:cytochrome d ubiquinol oxidase subunit II [Pontibacillus halophilus]KGX93806.1 membrane protein [Pontibacillus halophilus JSM 076056 = DSM 19796]